MASTPPNSISLYEINPTTNATIHSRFRRMIHAICNDPVQSTTTNTTNTHAIQIESAVDRIASTCVAMDTNWSLTRIGVPMDEGANNPSLFCNRNHLS